METTTPVNFWWLKKTTDETVIKPLAIPNLELNSTDSFSELLLEKDPDSDVDVGSIIEEINRVAAQSPLGPFARSIGERSLEDIIKETEKVYMESSKSFEQLSQRSKTSQNISELLTSRSNNSTPTPKSVSPLPVDSGSQYSEDFSQESKSKSEEVASHKDDFFDALENNEIINKVEEIVREKNNEIDSIPVNVPIDNQSELSLLVNPDPKLSCIQMLENNNFTKLNFIENRHDMAKVQSSKVDNNNSEVVDKLKEEISFRNRFIETLEEDNRLLKHDVEAARLQLEDTHTLLQQVKQELCSKSLLKSPGINIELEKSLEELKDTKELNTALQLQLNTINKTHQILKSSFEDLLLSNKNLERKSVELGATLERYKNELLNVQRAKDKLFENEANLNKLLEIEKLQSKSLKLQNEKDAKCIQDLNRQIKEMERIIARKHPDSVSALIVAAKEDASGTNLTARKVLEDRIRSLENEVTNRDIQSSKVFLEIQEKFNQMKNKYESHIEDLELHVNDLKEQLQKKSDTFDVYTQTVSAVKQMPQKDTNTIYTQTDVSPVTKPKTVCTAKKASETKDAHLLATIRGLQTDLSNKEKSIIRLQKEIEEVKKTNRRLQKEREGSLRSLSDKKEFRSYPERLSAQSRSSSAQDFRKEEELQQLRVEREKLRQQVTKLEEEYQNLKKKRLDDLTALQEAHEREISNYVTSVSPIREQLALQQVSIATLQSQLSAAKEELAILTVERDHLNNRILNTVHHYPASASKGDQDEVDALLKKISFLEKCYEEREYRLRAIVHSLAQKTVTNKSCEQCSQRQQQLIAYKNELDQLLASVRALK